MLISVIFSRQSETLPLRLHTHDETICFPLTASRSMVRRKYHEILTLLRIFFCPDPKKIMGHKNATSRGKNYQLLAVKPYWNPIHDILWVSDLTVIRLGVTKSLSVGKKSFYKLFLAQITFFIPQKAWKKIRTFDLRNTKLLLDLYKLA